jgi:predicted esterase
VSASANEPNQHESSPETGLQALAIPGFEQAAVVVPRDPRPVPLLVATHGAGGEAAWECERWGRVARERWFLLCPSGTPFRRGEPASFYRDHHALEREVMAAVGAARAKYGARIAERGGVYVGYSQGATMGALMLVDHGREFPHLLLIEGGSSDWTLARAQRFRATGGESVFIVCGTSGCGKRSTRAKPVLERAGLRAEAPTLSGGHTELGDVGAAAEKLLETLAQR